MVVGIDSTTNEIISGPDIISRGFVYVRESEDLMEQARIRARDAILNCTAKNSNDWNSMKTAVKNALSQYLYVETKRNPMILPVIMEV